MTNAGATSRRYDVLVLGAGMIGVCTALHLQMRGQRVCLVDRGEPGTGTSYGNAGLIERSSVVPYAFPHAMSRVVKYALNRQPEVHYQWGGLLGSASWLWQYWRNSASKPLERAAHDMLPLVERSTAEHAPLLKRAHLEGYVRKDGWIDVYRHPTALAAAARDAGALADQHGLDIEVLDREALRTCEPGILAPLIGGVHWRDSWTLEDPHAVVAGYASLFIEDDGTFCPADAGTLKQHDGHWTLADHSGNQIGASAVVVALGPDAGVVLDPLGYRFPLLCKRGYHLHYRPVPGVAELKHPLCDVAGGFVLSPMRHGIRMATGIEFARAGAPKDLTLIHRAHAIAQRIYPLGDAIEAEPWLGRRPCFPDMRPIIGPAPGHAGLWLNFGHNHHGMGLGAVSGRLLAEMMVGETPCVDPAPYAASRFLRAR